MTSPRIPVDLNKPSDDELKATDPFNLWIERTGCYALTPMRVALTPAMRAALNRLRINARLTQSDLAAGLGITREWISDLETGAIDSVHLDRYNALIDYCSDVMRGTVAA